MQAMAGRVRKATTGTASSASWSDDLGMVRMPERLLNEAVHDPDSVECLPSVEGSCRPNGRLLRVLELANPLAGGLLLTGVMRLIVKSKKAAHRVASVSDFVQYI